MQINKVHSVIMPTKISKICRFYAFNFYVHRFLSRMWQCVEIEQLNDYRQSGHIKIYGYFYIYIQNHSKIFLAYD